MAKHMAGKNQRPYSAEDRARRAAKADPRSTASELTPETLYAKQSSQSEKRVPSSIENLHFTPKPPKNGPEGFEETREYPVPAVQWNRRIPRRTAQGRGLHLCRTL